MLFAKCTTTTTLIISFSWLSISFHFCLCTHSIITLCVVCCLRSFISFFCELSNEIKFKILSVVQYYFILLRKRSVDLILYFLLLFFAHSHSFFHFAPFECDYIFEVSKMCIINLETIPHKVNSKMRVLIDNSWFFWRLLLFIFHFFIF
jgi:hypothetical protein